MSKRKQAILAGHQLTTLESRRGARRFMEPTRRRVTAIREGSNSLDAQPTGDSPDYVFFNASEAAFIEAAVDTLIPPDSAGPGALESNVPAFIDRRLATSSGRRGSINLGRTNNGGAWRHGNHLAWSAPALMKAGIADTAAHCLGTRGIVFADLPRRERGAVLTEISHGEADLAITPNATFYRLLLQLTVEGYLASPVGGETAQAWSDRAASSIAPATSANVWSSPLSL
jgi:hypothetical protein